MVFILHFHFLGNSFFSSPLALGDVCFKFSWFGTRAPQVIMDITTPTVCLKYEFLIQSMDDFTEISFTHSTKKMYQLNKIKSI